MRLLQRRSTLFGLALAALTPGVALAARQRLVLATGAVPPLTSAPGQIGFLDALATEVFGRIGIDVTLQPTPMERGLINANAGIEDGEIYRAPGFEKDYPNLVQVPEKVMDFELVAYTNRADLRVRNWDDLAPFSVGHITGWTAVERNLGAVRQVTTVRDSGQLIPMLASGRVDVVVLGRSEIFLRRARDAGLVLRAIEPPLARLPMFTYLHRRHEALVLPLAAALAEVKRDGTWQRLYDQTLKPREPNR